MKKTAYFIAILWLCSCTSPDLTGHWHLFINDSTEITTVDIFGDTLVWGSSLDISTIDFVGDSLFFFGEKNEIFDRYAFDFKNDSCTLTDRLYKVVLVKKSICKPIIDKLLTIELETILPEIINNDQLKGYKQTQENIEYFCAFPRSKLQTICYPVYRVLVNDRFCNITDIPNFENSYNSKIYKRTLLIDRYTKIRDLSKIFSIFRLMNVNQVDIAVKYSEKLDDVYVYTQKLKKFVPQYEIPLQKLFNDELIRLNDGIYENIPECLMPLDTNNICFSLKLGKLLHKEKEIDHKELKNILDMFVTKPMRKSIVVKYDYGSTFDEYIQLRQKLWNYVSNSEIVDLFPIDLEVEEYFLLIMLNKFMQIKFT